MTTRFKICLMLVVFVMLGGVLLGPMMSQVEQPSYQVLQKEGAITVRRYPTLLVAQVLQRRVSYFSRLYFW